MLRFQREAADRIGEDFLLERQNLTGSEGIPSTRERPDAFVAVCAWCKRIRDAKGSWVLPELYEEVPGEWATHGICPACVERFLPIVE
ncbi:MAG: hypothetical protein M1497_03475 [Nitrospirae bacterium]|nr:hypothetical protein [Nitrospirota bacterium]